MALTSESATLFGGEVYSSLTRKVADSFDDFEIEYDIIQDATDEELKEFFLRLQEGMSLTSSEKCYYITDLFGRGRSVNRPILIDRGRLTLASGL